MAKTQTKRYLLDGDEVEAVQRYDDRSGLWLEDYIDFETVPRYTPNGRRWRSVTTTGCPYADPVYRDCGTCDKLLKVDADDLFGVCTHEALQRKPII